MYRTIYVTMLVLMCIFPRLRNLLNVSFYLRNLASNHNVVVYSIIFFNFFFNKTCDLFQYYVLINIDQVNKLNFYDWIILISA